MAQRIHRKIIRIKGENFFMRKKPKEKPTIITLPLRYIEEKANKK